jgi:hypothetical protein
MATQFKFRRDTSLNWATRNPVLASGEPGLETDTGKLKIGNGSSTWTQLGYFAGSGSGGNTGYTGSAGAIGYAGSRGVAGYNGSNGLPGYTGSTGSAGYTGSLGPAGYTGSAAPLTSFYVNFTSTAPTDPVLGQLWYDSANSQLKIYNGNTWVAI